MSAPDEVQDRQPVRGAVCISCGCPRAWNWHDPELCTDPDMR